MKSLWTFSTTVNIPAEEIFGMLSDIREGEFDELSAPFVVAGKGKVKIAFDKVHYVVTFEDDHREFISVDKEKMMLAVQGEWWYRGEYTLTAEGEQTRVELNVFNLADQGWMVSLMNINARRKHEIEFLSFCKSLERKLA
ncbi:MAG TPA: hypothetical protein VK826_05415 [Bacteroidia bacterium]|nr:hypothetical protein [Bacteroidia bacterium]